MLLLAKNIIYFNNETLVSCTHNTYIISSEISSEQNRHFYDTFQFHSRRNKLIDDVEGMVTNQKVVSKNKKEDVVIQDKKDLLHSSKTTPMGNTNSFTCNPPLMNPLVSTVRQFKKERLCEKSGSNPSTNWSWSLELKSVEPMFISVEQIKKVREKFRFRSISTPVLTLITITWRTYFAGSTF